MDLCIAEFYRALTNASAWKGAFALYSIGLCFLLAEHIEPAGVEDKRLRSASVQFDRKIYVVINELEGDSKGIHSLRESAGIGHVYRWIKAICREDHVNLERGRPCDLLLLMITVILTYCSGHCD